MVHQISLSEKALTVIDGVVTLIRAAMITEDPVTPPPLRDTLQILHGKELCYSLQFIDMFTSNGYIHIAILFVWSVACLCVQSV